jgi:flagellin-like protein
MKLSKSRKALSPVVASIILIAVTVAVSIAVAAWMGALTFNFTNTEQITYTGYTWGTGSILIKIKNTGSADLSIAEVRVDSVTATQNQTLPLAMVKGQESTFNITKSFTSGIQYEFSVVTTKGNLFGPYIKTAP